LMAITMAITMAIAMTTPQAIRYHSTTIKGKNHNSMHYLYFNLLWSFTNTFLLLSSSLFLSNPKAAANDGNDDDDKE